MTSDRQQQPLRLPPDHKERLRKAALRRRVSIQNYMHMAVMERVDADEAAHEQWRESRRSRREEPGGIPRGLGLRFPKAPEPTPSPVATTSPPVVLQVSPTTANPGEIERLAIWVAGGPSFTRDQRLRQVVEMLRPSCGSEREREELGRQLDAAVAERLKRHGDRGAGAARTIWSDLGNKSR